jgi:hypothetical protein
VIRNENERLKKRAPMRAPQPLVFTLAGSKKSRGGPTDA